MDEILNSNPQEDLSSPGGMVQSAPPPPSEVKVRTMRSDLESMARSGGGLPRFENVKVSGLALEKKDADPGTEKKKAAMIALIAVAVLVVLGVTGYFAYRAFVGPSAAAPAPVTQGTATSTAPANPGISPSSTTSGATQAFVHKSSFKKVPDQMIAVTMGGGTVANANQLESYGQKLLSALAAANKTPDFIEVDAKGADGHDLSANELLAWAGAPILDPQFLSAHFSPDATFFVYRDKSGFWPGYVIPLGINENWLFLKSDVQKLESSGSLSNLFLASVGSPAAGGFADATVASTSVRIISFEGTPPASLVYGWSGNYLIISTSPAGFGQAVARL